MKKHVGNKIVYKELPINLTSSPFFFIETIPGSYPDRRREMQNPVRGNHVHKEEDKPLRITQLENKLGVLKLLGGKAEKRSCALPMLWMYGQ